MRLGHWFGCAAAALMLTTTPAIASTALSAAQLCRKQISIQGRKYAEKRRKFLLICIDKLLKCDLQSEIDAANPKSCRDAAITSCTAKVGSAPTSALSVAATKFETIAGAACLPPMAFADVLSAGAGGLGFGNDPECGASGDLPTLLSCLRDELNPSVDGVVGRLKPRGGILLDNVGLGADFPDLPRPPTVPVNVAATAPASCLLINPGGGSIAAGVGDAIQFSGDSGTLPFGMSMNNGSLTIGVGGATPCTSPDQEYVLKEPYGPGSTITFGPFTSDQNYCIALKDQSCMNSVTGVIDLP